MMLAALPVTPILPPPDKLAGVGLRIGIVLVLAFIVQRLFFMLWGRVSRMVVRSADDDRAAAQRVKSLTEVVRHLTTAAVLLFTLIYVLELLGWDVKPLLAGAGIIGVAVGLGAQSLVRDWIAGAFILTENQFGLGDVIEVSGRAATVEAIHLRSTQLRDSQGFVYFVPNGEFKTVINRTRGWNRVPVDVRVRAGQDLDRALERCGEVARQVSADPAWQDRLLEPVQVLGVERLGADVSIRMTVRARAGPHAADGARELRRRLHQALSAAGFEYPWAVLPSSLDPEAPL